MTHSLVRYRTCIRQQVYSSPAKMMAAVQCMAVHGGPPICPFRQEPSMHFIATGTSYHSVPVADANLKVATVDYLHN